MSRKRTYDDGCYAAQALDLIGERWALLVVRELLFGPRRFSDLQSSLRGISPNVLTQRLHELEEAGILTRYQLSPPAASWVYELTEWGQELEGVLQQLGRWGARSPQQRPGLPVSVATVMVGMRTMFRSELSDHLDATIQVNLGRESFTVMIQQGELIVKRGANEKADVSLTTSLETLNAVIFGDQPLTQAEAAGALSIKGDHLLAEKFTRLFATST